MPKAPTDFSDERVRQALLAEALAAWRWAKQVEAGWELELHEVMRHLAGARQEVDLRRAVYLALEAEIDEISCLG